MDVRDRRKSSDRAVGGQRDVVASVANGRATGCAAMSRLTRATCNSRLAGAGQDAVRMVVGGCCAAVGGERAESSDSSDGGGER